MSERLSGELPRLTELPEPYKGVASQVFFDLLANRSEFIYKSLNNMKEENPHLASAMITDLIASPTPEITSNWLLSYYEIFSRSARKINQGMLLVTQDLIDAYDARDTQEIKITSQSQSTAIEYRELFERKTQDLIEVDVRSGELAFFWGHQHILHTRLRLSGEGLEKVNLAFEGLYLTQIYLHSQQEANRLTKKFTP